MYFIEVIFVNDISMYTEYKAYKKIVVVIAKSKQYFPFCKIFGKGERGAQASPHKLFLQIK